MIFRIRFRGGQFNLPQNNDGPGGYRDRPVSVHMLRLGGIAGGLGGVNNEFPAHPELFPGDGEVNVVVVGVEHQQERVVFNLLAPPVGLDNAAPIQIHHEGLAEGEFPVALGHEPAGGHQPGNIPVGSIKTERVAGEESTPSKHWVVFPNPNEPLGEFQQVRVGVHEIPVDPGQFIVLTVNIIIALLGAGYFVTVGNHGGALRQQEGGEEVTALLVPQLVDGRVVGGAFHATVPRPVMGFPIPIVFPIGQVVLGIVADQVVEGEPVVGGHKVNGGRGSAPIMGVQVGGAGEPGGEFAQGGGLAPPKVPHRVPVFTVPFRPQGGEVTNLVAAFAHIPRFGNELHAGHHRVLLHQVEEGGQPVHVVQLPGQGGGQVEAEPIHMHFLHPVAQRIHNHLQRVRVPHIEGVAGARVVHVVGFRIVDKPVVRVIVDAAERNGRAQVVAFGGVVVHHIQNHLKAGLVERPHHALEFVDGATHLNAGRIILVRSEEPEGVIPPIVPQP